ncbi:hypothetical protein [Jiella marina]|uniref:hypothetical protein n=1 Tax=Jiella sp. LLJ827 TaxID=2917712 RepID=UPI0021007D21|nr:hypothetical protein [Jiella sp. LLJ827]MCQ0986543.1 hypothetical protein [Jiella sp. LLJ827]
MFWQMVAKLVTGEAGVYLARMRRLAGLYVILAILGLLIVGFLMGALYVYIASLVGPLAASLIFAAAFFVLAIITYAMTIVVRRPPRKRADDRLERDIASIAGVAALSNAPLLFQSARRNKKLLLIPAMGAVGWAVWRAFTSYRHRDEF